MFLPKARRVGALAANESGNRSFLAAGALWQVTDSRSIPTNPPTSARENTINCPDADGLLLDFTRDENPSLANFHRISVINARP